MKKMLALALVAGCAASANATVQCWNEIPDAGAFAINGPMAQDTVGTGSLGQICGMGDGRDDFVDSYCIYISDPANFSATTVGGAAFDTQLWLFTETGFGVTFNDDSQATTQSTLTSQFLLNQPGHYVLAISRYDADALGVTGGQIWSDTPFGTERTPDGPAAASAVFGWSTDFLALEEYTINLTGAEYCTVPAPSALALMGLGGLIAGRRKR